MPSFSQAISDVFSAIFQFFAAIFQTVVSVLQSVTSVLYSLVKDAATLPVKIIDFILQNIVILIAIVGAFSLYGLYRQRQGKTVVPERKTN